MPKNVPSFKRTDNGKFINGRRQVTELTNAVYADKIQVTVDGVILHIKESNRTEDDWIVLVEVQG